MFGWTVAKWGPVDYWTMTTGAEPGPGAEGALTPRAEAPEGVVVYVGVEDIDRALVGVQDAGGTVVNGKMPIPTVGWSARFRDTEAMSSACSRRARRSRCPPATFPVEHPRPLALSTPETPTAGT